QLHGEPIYYTTRCILHVSTSLLAPGFYNISVTMYPIVTNDETSIQYGTTYSHTLILENPSGVQNDCPRQVEEGSQVNCTCKTTRQETRGVSVSWFDTNGQMVNPDQPHVLIFRAKRNSQG
ncbi:unnamed protein product, partial [Lymnaea stagnalis]